MCLYATCVQVPSEGRKAIRCLEQELLVFVSLPTWVLGTELRPLEEQQVFLYSRATSLAPEVFKQQIFGNATTVVYLITFYKCFRFGDNGKRLMSITVSSKPSAHISFNLHNKHMNQVL